MLKYDEVMNKQRTVIYEERRRVLDGEDLHEQVQHMIDEVVRRLRRRAPPAEGYAEDWDPDTLWTALKTLYPISRDPRRARSRRPAAAPTSPGDSSPRRSVADAQAAYDKREEDAGSEVMRELERRVVLSVLDRKWREHLYEMDYLQEGIGLRAMAQRDPLVEYQREGYDMFSAMLDAIKEESVGFLFNLEVEVEDQPDAHGRRPARLGRQVRRAGAEEARAPADDVEEADEAPAHQGEGAGEASASEEARLHRPDHRR